MVLYSCYALLLGSAELNRLAITQTCMNCVHRNVCSCLTKDCFPVGQESEC